ncbi:MAG: hypothetical protein KY429_00600 [Actinobacteria bacterium]|nr:hypothetical protein [Actinomycetota bacterium]
MSRLLCRRIGHLSPNCWIGTAESYWPSKRPWRLSDKLPRYSEAAVLEDCPRYLLFCFTEIEAEIAARKVLGGCELTIATATLEEHIAHPLGRNWLTFHSKSRKALTELSHE